MADRGVALRLFIAVDVPASHKLSIERSIQDLRLQLPEARWIPRESWHVTLKFLGEVAEDRVADVLRVTGRACTDAVALSSRLTEVGAFPTLRRARVIWVAIEDPDEALARLAARLERDLGKRGFRKEGRKLHPHLTLARLRTPLPVGEAVESSGPYRLEPSRFDIGEAILFRSHLSPRGATYEALETFALGGGEA